VKSQSTGADKGKAALKRTKSRTITNQGWKMASKNSVF